MCDFRKDALLPLCSGEKLKGGLPTANFAVMDRCGHMPPIERPEAFLREAERFWDVATPPQNKYTLVPYAMLCHAMPIHPAAIINPRTRLGEHVSIW